MTEGILNKRVPRRVQEGERELAAVDRLADVLGLDSRAVEAAYEPHDLARGAGERAVVRLSENPERHEPIDVPGFDSAAISESVTREPVGHRWDGSHSPSSGAGREPA